MASYGSRPEPRRRPGTWRSTDTRYASYRWKVRTRLPVLRRDGYRCWVTGCTARANVCDHFDAVTPATTDREFFDQSRLRASCRAHNLARAFTRAEHEEEFGMKARPGGFRLQCATVRRDYTRRGP